MSSLSIIAPSFALGWLFHMRLVFLERGVEFRVRSLVGLGIEGGMLGVIACGALAILLPERRNDVVWAAFAVGIASLLGSKEIGRILSSFISRKLKVEYKKRNGSCNENSGTETEGTDPPGNRL